MNKAKLHALAVQISELLKDASLILATNPNDLEKGEDAKALYQVTAKFATRSYSSVQTLFGVIKESPERKELIEFERKHMTPIPAPKK